ncbi:MAG TPA: prepilin-type N-terminal cleavage/methylation domain-containing protein [Planctomycetota bacterium]|nr:prepilin-type N-terminal cleavage/methylation domain-containing protein [Planctomycetota bacterium]
MTRRGFTLLEVILATTLFALLMSSYYSIFLNVSDLERYARSQRAFSAVGPAVLNLMEDDMLSLYTNPRAQSAFPFRGEDGSRGSQPADSMNFVVMRPSVHKEEFFDHKNLISSPINEVGYRLARGEGDVRRLYRRESFYVDGTPLQGGEYFEVYDRVLALDVLYVGYPAEEEERRSQTTLGQHRLDTFESWNSEERHALPTAMVVTLTVEPPQIGDEVRPAEGSEATRPQRTFVRILQVIQADDVLPPKPTGNAPETQPNR